MNRSRPGPCPCGKERKTRERKGLPGHYCQFLILEALDYNKKKMELFIDEKLENKDRENKAICGELGGFSSFQKITAFSVFLTP